MHWAAINNRLAIAKLLVSHGADVNAPGGKLQEIPLQWACRNDAFTGMAQFLIEAGSDLTHRSAHGLDALHVACRMGNVNMAFLILAAGASPDTRDGQGNVPLHFLLKTQAEYDSYEVQRLLLAFGADVAATDADGNNAMHLMALAGRPFTETRLALLYVNTLAAPADVYRVFEHKNSEGLTVPQVAARAANTTMLNFWFDLRVKMVVHPAVPTVASSLMLAAPLLLLHVMGWSWFMPVAAVVAVSALKMLTLSSISSSRTGFAWGNIITAEASYFLCAAPHYDTAVNVVVLALGVAICYTLYQSVTTTATALPRRTNRAALVEALAHAGGKEGPGADGDGTAAATPDGTPPPPPAHVPRLCTTCLADKTQATMHCSRCNICVVGLDHHCPFVDNCVGRGNRRVFVLFTFFASFGCMLNAFMSWLVQVFYTCPEIEGSGLGAFVVVQVCVIIKQPMFFFAPWLALFTSFWIFVLFFHQMWMVAAATTTYDMVKGLHDGKGNSLQSSLSNLREFFLTGNFHVQPRLRRKPTHAAAEPHSHGGNADAAAVAAVPGDSAGTEVDAGNNTSNGSGNGNNNADMTIASLAATTMSSISASVAPMVLADTEVTPLLDDGNEDGLAGDGDTEEGMFLGSKHKVTAAVVTSAAEAADTHSPRTAHGAGHAGAAAGHQDSASSYSFLPNMTLRRLFFATPMEKKDDDAEGDVSMRAVK